MPSRTQSSWTELDLNHKTPLAKFCVWILIWWLFIYIEILCYCRYTSFAGLFPLLSRGTLPLVKVEEISQTIDSENFTVQNSVQFSGPLATTSISTNAKFEVRSPKRVQVCFALHDQHPPYLHFNGAKSLEIIINQHEIISWAFQYRILLSSLSSNCFKIVSLH